MNGTSSEVVGCVHRVVCAHAAHCHNTGRRHVLVNGLCVRLRRPVTVGALVRSGIFCYFQIYQLFIGM